MLNAQFRRKLQQNPEPSARAVRPEVFKAPETSSAPQDPQDVYVPRDPSQEPAESAHRRVS